MTRINFGFILDHIAEHTPIFRSVLERAVKEASIDSELNFNWKVSIDNLLVSEAYNAFLKIDNDSNNFQNLDKIKLTSLYLVSPNYQQQILAEIEKYQAKTNQTTSPNPALNQQQA